MEFGERSASFLVCEPMCFEQMSSAELPATDFTHVVLPPASAGLELGFFSVGLLLLLLLMVLKVLAAALIFCSGRVMMRRLSGVQRGDGVQQTLLQLHRLVVAVHQLRWEREEPMEHGRGF